MSPDLNLKEPTWNPWESPNGFIGFYKDLYIHNGSFVDPALAFIAEQFAQALINLEKPKWNPLEQSHGFIGV